ncbi:MAG: hypothetical protein RIR00_560, partial [Pseudomonadota bacterium]
MGRWSGKGNGVVTMIRGLLRGGVLLLTLLLAYPVWALGPDEVGRATGPTLIRIGVLAFRGPAKAEAEWAPTANYLNTRLPGYRFVVQPMDYHVLSQAVRDRRIELLITNSG